MDDPQTRLDRSIERAAEITWWNRQMTKLAEVDGIDNAPSFVSKEIVEQKGPYVEFVEAPKFHDQSAAEFLRGLDYDEAVIDAVRNQLFDGSGAFYQHQAETMEAIAADRNDNILAVPTATGKTEAFFLPILDHCLKTDEFGLKAIVLYPMKTLGVDQLNRFIAYLDQINRHRDPADRITIGIWDSDTPQRVGTRDYEIEEGAYVRGLECPREEDEKLRVLGEMNVGTDDHQYPWIRVTRESIRHGVDILLTGPEALDHMFVSDNDETRDVLGNDPGEHPVEHIVFDEAHVWSGIQGAAISLLSRRLKAFYDDRDPQVTMVSATVANPPELASALTGSLEHEINSIQFTGRQFDAHDSPDFGRFEPCNVDDISQTLALAHVGNHDTATVESRFGLGDAVATLREVGLLAPTDPLQLGEATGTWVTDPIERGVETALADGLYDTPADVVEARRGRERVAESILDASGTDTGWYSFVLDAVPEVATFADWFDEGTTGPVGFKHYEELLSLLDGPSVEDQRGTLETVMAFGRLAGVVTEKYHTFLKPPQQVYWCRDCKRVTRNNRCPHCGNRLAELRFCKSCHEPYVEVDRNSDEENSDEDVFAPVALGQHVDTCPGCDRSPNLSDIGVPTPTLLSYMLTEVCRASSSKKTLVFSDSRRTAESVADQIIQTEYGLMAETLYVHELIERNGHADNYDLFRAVADRMREEYWQPLIQNEFDEDGMAYNFLRTYLDEIEGHAMLYNCEHLLESALVTADPVLDVDDPRGLVVRHELYKLFALDPSGGFTMNRISFEGLTRAKLIDRLHSRAGFTRETVAAHLDDAIVALVDEGILVQQPWEEVRQRVQDSNRDQEAKDEIFEHLEDARDDLVDRGIVDTAESGLFTRAIRKDQSDLRLLSETTFCTECYRSYPVGLDGTAVSQCPNCGTAIETARRFHRNDDGTLVASPGYAEIPSAWPYALDHWAHDVTRPIRDGNDPDFITVGIHKGDTPHAVRGAIEEGFRRDDPAVNIVSATPTMELGVDIGTLETVAQVGIPPTLTNYVQRSGRTGRTRGSSSLVMTAIRGSHPVDSHYYSNLEAFLDEFEPVRVPDPFRFNELLAGHVVTETFAYLARNPHEANVFKRLYTLQETKESLGVFVSEVEERLDIFREFILEERREAVTRHLRSVFGEPGVEIFEAVFEGDGPLALDNRVQHTFSKLVSMSASTEANKNVAETNRRLDQWLQRLGYLANYRNFGQQFPVKFSGRTEGIEFESSGRLYDLYPGEENGLGAAITMHGTDYLVADVHGTTTPLTTVEVCENDECDRPFQGYETDTDECPHCGTALTETAIHGISSVECQAARGGQKGYTTRGLLTTYVDAPDITEATAETTLFGLPCNLVYGEREVTDFVYAFERWHRASRKKKLLRSEALIEQDEREASSGQSWRERMDDVEEEIYRPVGQQYFTQGLTLRFDAAQLRARYEQVTHEIASWPQALVSFEQALEKAIAVVAECDQDDFRVTTSTGPDHVDIHIVDSRQGGNGISWQVHDRLSVVAREVREVAQCDRCVDYCDECLLLSRTPAYYLENDLLDRRTLAAIVGLDEQMTGEAETGEPA